MPLQESKDILGISDHSYMEYWDTDDENNLPFFVGMGDSEKPSPYTSSFFKSVKAGLEDAAVQTWMTTELQGSLGNGACRASRKLLKYDDTWLHVPKMTEPTSEVTTDVTFYVAQIASGSTIDEVEFQDVSYRGYWALAKHGYKIGDKPSLDDNNKMLLEVKSLCSDLADDDHKACIAAQDSQLVELEKQLDLAKLRRNITKRTSRRHLSSYSCNQELRDKGKGKFFVRKETILYECDTNCEAEKGVNKNKKHQINIRKGKEYKDGKFAVKFLLRTDFQRNAGATFGQWWLEQKFCLEYELIFEKNRRLPKMQNQRRVGHWWKWDYIRINRGALSNEKFTAGLTVQGTVPLAIDGGYLDQTLEASGQLSYARPHPLRKRSISGRIGIKWTVGKSYCKTYFRQFFGTEATLEFYLGAATEIGPNGVT